MSEKKRYIAVSVTTFEALDACMEDQVKLFCIENPVYSVIKEQGWDMSRFAEYDIEDYGDKEIMLLKKVRGTSVFNDETYMPFYLPLTWENWKS